MKISLTALKKQQGVIVSLDMMLGMLMTFVVSISLMVVITDALFPWLTNTIAYLQEIFLQTNAQQIIANCTAQGTCNQTLPSGVTLQEAANQLPNLQN